MSRMPRAALSPDVDLTRAIDWLGLRLRVPEDWEIVRHGLDPARGRLVWVDRRRERLTLAWSRCPSRPDLGRVVSDYRSVLAAELGAASVRSPVDLGDFRAVAAVSVETDRAVTRAVRWDAVGGRLLEAVVLGRASAPGDRALPRRLLMALHVSDSAEGARRFQAFDVDVEVPSGLRLVALTPRPGDVALTFRPGQISARGAGRGEATLRRLGMADSWYAGDLEGVLRRQEPGARFDRVERLERDGATSLLATGSEPGPRWRRVLRRLRVQRSLAWECPAENAVYLVSTRSPERSPLLPSAFSVRCREAAS